MLGVKISACVFAVVMLVGVVGGLLVYAEHLDKK